MTRVFALLLLAATLGAASVEKDPIGRPAPDFTLPGLDGKPVGLAQYRDKVLVLQWFNADCPFNARVYDDGTVQRTLDAIERLGPDYAFIAINSTAIKPAADLVSESKALLEETKVDVPVLIDADGVVGRRYRARTTPQIFIIERGVLRYRGAFTNNPWGKPGATTNYAIQALQQIAAGRKVDPSYVRPWGCSVKYE